MATPSQVQNMAANIFADMVMEEAIKDKTIQVENKMKDEEGQLIDMDKVGEYNFGGSEPVQHEDEDDMLDEEEEKIMRQFREDRLAEIKSNYAES